MDKSSWLRPWQLATYIHILPKVSSSKPCTDVQISQGMTVRYLKQKQRIPHTQSEDTDRATTNKQRNRSVDKIQKVSSQLLFVEIISSTHERTPWRSFYRKSLNNWQTIKYQTTKSYKNQTNEFFVAFYNIQPGNTLRNEAATSWSQVRCPTHCAIILPQKVYYEILHTGWNVTVEQCQYYQLLLFT